MMTMSFVPLKRVLFVLCILLQLVNTQQQQYGRRRYERLPLQSETNSEMFEDGSDVEVSS